jgi:hypothetical protein
MYEKSESNPLFFRCEGRKLLNSRNTVSMDFFSSVSMENSSEFGRQQVQVNSVLII